MEAALAASTVRLQQIAAEVHRLVYIVAEEGCTTGTVMPIGWMHAGLYAGPKSRHVWSAVLARRGLPLLAGGTVQLHGHGGSRTGGYHCGQGGPSQNSPGAGYPLLLLSPSQPGENWII